jgi:hypothetical protein
LESSFESARPADITWAAKKFPGMKCRAISAQFMADDRVAMFELTIQNDLVVVLDEKHYKLVPASELDKQALPEVTSLRRA